VIESDEAVRRLVSAAVSIGPDWERHLEDWDGEPAGFYNDVAIVAHHVVALMAAGNHAEIRAVFAEVEVMLGHDLSVDARTLLIIGFLEDVQNIASHEDVGVQSSAFAPFFGPATLMAWVEVHGFWGSVDT
jgi:hypothetical protein